LRRVPNHPIMPWVVLQSFSFFEPELIKLAINSAMLETEDVVIKASCHVVLSPPFAESYTKYYADAVC
jgi:hypothetical protein